MQISQSYYTPTSVPLHLVCLHDLPFFLLAPLLLVFCAPLSHMPWPPSFLPTCSTAILLILCLTQFHLITCSSLSLSPALAPSTPPSLLLLLLLLLISCSCSSSLYHVPAFLLLLLFLLLVSCTASKTNKDPQALR